MQLANNHIFYTSSSAVAELAMPLTQLGITYFSYMKSDMNGSRIYLYNKPEILNSYLKNQYYLRGNKEATPVSYDKQICLWSTLPNQQEYDENIRARGIDHGMFIFEPNDTSLEAFAFATKKENQGIINTYLTKLDSFKNFTYDFREKAAGLIKLAERSKIILPFHNMKSSRPEKIEGKNPLEYNKLLSKRQFECCTLLLEGKTSKDIAILLGLSIRTVEYYFSNIKIKLDCQNKTELIRKLVDLLGNKYKFLG